MKQIMIAIIALALVAGCGSHCIQVTGAHGEYEGGLQYCWDVQKSQESGVPTFNVTTPDSEHKGGWKDVLYGFGGELVEKIRDKLKEKLGMSAKAAVAEPEKHPVKEILELLETEVKNDAEPDTR
jgi:hypothetical protein